MVKRPESFVTAIPSTLLLDNDITSMEMIRPIIATKIEIPTIITNECLFNENRINVMIVTTNEINVGIPNLEIKYPCLPSGVTDR